MSPFEAGFLETCNALGLSKEGGSVLFKWAEAHTSGLQELQEADFGLVHDYQGDFSKV